MKTEFYELIMANYQGLGYYALRITKNPDDAYDLVHDTVVRAITREDQFQHGTDFWKWISRIQYTVFIDGLRRRKSDLLRRGQLSERSVDPVQINRVYVKEVLKQIGGLPDIQRKVLLSLASENTHEEISKDLGVPIGTVRSRLFRARQELAA